MTSAGVAIVVLLCYLAVAADRKTNQQDTWSDRLKGFCNASSPVESGVGEEVRISLENNHNWAYAGVIEIGNPPQRLRMEFDTGSADLWVSSSIMCEMNSTFCRGHLLYNHSDSSTYKEDGRPAQLEYGTGLVKGFISQDDVVINGINIKNQKFLEATFRSLPYNALKFPELKDGILGLGFPTVANLLVPTPLCNMVTQRLLKRPVFSFYLNKVDPSSETGQGSGELVLGGINPDHFTGEIIYAPVPENARNWKVIDCSLMNSGSLPNVAFFINGIKFVLTPDDYIVKEYSSKDCLFGFNHFKKKELPFLIFGNVFMRKVYTVFDIENMQIGFATAK